MSLCPKKNRRRYGSLIPDLFHGPEFCRRNLKCLGRGLFAINQYSAGGVTITPDCFMLQEPG